MPTHYTYPGVYVEEIPSEVRTITGVSTSNTAFVDFFAFGPVNEPKRITSFGDFDRQFGGLDIRSEASYAIQQYYLNGGSIAWIVRVVASNARKAMRALTYSEGGSYYGYGDGETVTVLKVWAASPGAWGNWLQVAVDHNVPLDPQTGRRKKEFNLVVREVVEENGRLQVSRSETYRNLSMSRTTSRFAVDVVNEASTLVQLEKVTSLEDELPGKTGDDVIGDPDTAEFLWLGKDGYQKGTKDCRPKRGWLGHVKYEKGGNGFTPETDRWKEVEGEKALLGSESEKTGMYALDKIEREVFNILCLPAAAKLSPKSMLNLIAEAEEYCEDKRAFFIVDIPSKMDELPDAKSKLERMTKWLEELEGKGLRRRNTAVYFPRMEMDDILNENRPRKIGASGTLAGVYARIDATRGVWKAPAGTEASLRGVRLDTQINDLENGGLNPLGINALRTFPIHGNVCWGARTLEGADQQASEWKYIPIRRLALFIEESLYRGLKWVVFEPNDEPLWAQIRLNVGAFMHNLFRQGAFQGASPREAYFVKCDKETTTQNDRDRGIVNIVVGFAPLKPAEFVVIKIQQIAGQIQS